ncbi:MAG: hypothetical protein RL220_845, partial [Bacteroidota bacterium]
FVHSLFIKRGCANILCKPAPSQRFYLWKQLMRRLFTSGLAVIFTAMVLPAFAQEVTVINRFEGDTTGKGMENFRLRESTEQRIIINYYEPIEQEQSDRLQDLINASLSLYLDQNIAREKNKLVLRKPRKQMVREMNEIVSGSVKYYDFKEVQPFEGFSAAIDEKLAYLEKLDLSKTDWAKSTNDDKKLNELATAFTLREMKDIKQLARNEVLQYSEDNLVALAETETTFTDQQTRDQLMQDWTTYDRESMLPISKSNPSGIVLLSVEDRSQLPGGAAIAPVAGSDVYLQQMLDMMKANQEEMRSLRQEFYAFQQDQMAMWRQNEERNNLALQDQIDDLKGMVVELIRYNGAPLASTDPVITRPSGETLSSPMPVNLPQYVNIYFPTGSTDINAAGMLALNEVIDILARYPSIDLIITGFTDNTGDEMKNLILSQERAKAVKKFLANSGLRDDRFVTRFVGEQDSSSASQLDRRVSVEFVLNR